MYRTNRKQWYVTVVSRCTFILNVMQFWSPSSYVPKDTGKKNQREKQKDGDDG